MAERAKKKATQRTLFVALYIIVALTLYHSGSKHILRKVSDGMVWYGMVTFLYTVNPSAKIIK